ncbi:hypothetical protein [Arthrobacter sp. AD-310]
MSRIVLLVLLGFTAATSIISGLVMLVQTWLGPGAVALPPEASLPLWLLQDSPFESYLVPGLILTVVVGGTHLAAFVLTLRRSHPARFVTAVAAFAILIWIFVQMVFIPFSALQALYFAVGLAELGFLLLSLGLLAGHGPADHVVAAVPPLTTGRGTRPGNRPTPRKAP